MARITCADLGIVTEFAWRGIQVSEITLTYWAKAKCSQNCVIQIEGCGLMLPRELAHMSPDIIRLCYLAIGANIDNATDYSRRTWNYRLATESFRLDGSRATTVPVFYGEDSLALELLKASV